MRQAHQVEAAATDAEEEERARFFGIKGVPILSQLHSLSFPASFPHDFMHLIFENVIQTLLAHWTGDFKDLDEDGGSTTEASWSAMTALRISPLADSTTISSIVFDVHFVWVLASKA